MKVLRVINSMNPVKGGPCEGIRNSIPELKKYGVESDVLCLDAPEETFIGKDNFKVYAIGPAVGPWAKSSSLKPWLMQHLSNYDVVIVHGLWQYHSHAVVKVANTLKSKNKPCPKVYVMPHGMLDPYFQKAPGRKIKAIRNSLFWYFIEKHVINTSDGILFTCKEELELAAQTFKDYSPKAVYNVGYGINAPVPYNDNLSKKFTNQYPALLNKSMILFLSRIHEKKGVDLLLKAFEMSYSKITTNVPALVIAGPGMETDYGQSLQAIIDNSTFLKAHVHCVGMLQGDLKWGAFHSCEVFALPSHQENFGIAVVEALACGKPTLISNKVNIWREIHDNYAGFVDTDDANGVNTILKKWRDTSTSERVMMSKHAIETYQKYFTIEQAAINLFNVLKTNLKHA